jgi:hypothetical protein
MGKVATKAVKDISLPKLSITDPVAILLSKHFDLEVKRAALHLKQFVNNHAEEKA